jgi:hypothetical protein
MIGKSEYVVGCFRCLSTWQSWKLELPFFTESYFVKHELKGMLKYRGVKTRNRDR